jgi:hypothetical protein
VHFDLAATASMAGRAWMEDRRTVNWRPPWLDTMIASAPVFGQLGVFGVLNTLEDQLATAVATHSISAHVKAGSN